MYNIGKNNRKIKYEEELKRSLVHLLPAQSLSILIVL